jgi:hypothetical protein
MIKLWTKTTEVEIDEQTIEALQSKWPSRDVQVELKRMHLWLLRYPVRRPATIWRFVDNWLKKAPAVIRPPTIVYAWWATDERTINQGAALGLEPRPGESMVQFKDRVGDKLKRSA